MNQHESENVKKKLKNNYIYSAVLNYGPHIRNILQLKNHGQNLFRE